MKNNNIIIFLLFSSLLGYSQQGNPELDSLVSKAITNNKNIKSGQLQVDKSKEVIKLAYDFEKTNVY